VVLAGWTIRGRPAAAAEREEEQLMRTRFLPALGVGLVVAAVDFVGLLPGWWWLTPAVAFLVAVLLRGAAAFCWMVLGSLAGWTVMLFWHGAGSINRIANLVGDIALNTGGQAWLIITATFLLALLLALTAGWFGSALRRLVTPRPAADAP
jgi:hypothetical protein